MNSQAVDATVREGQIVFKNQCQKCHPGGESGVGPPINNIHLPGFLVRARIRSRAFLLWMGRMPAFDKHEISKKEMDVLIQYLKYMRKKV
jgi:mono/diheme cytochrome c family protein